MPCGEAHWFAEVRVHRSSVRVPSGEAALRSAARVLSALLLERIEHSAPSNVDWESAGPELVTLARRHKVASMLSTVPSFKRLSAEVQELLQRERRKTVMRNMTNLARTVAVLEALEEAGVSAVVLKGQGFSQFAYGDWSDRGASVDVDVLVPDRGLARAHRALLTRGFVCVSDGPRRPPLHGWLGRYNGWLHYERTYTSVELGTVDLHWRVMPGGASWTSFDAVWSRRQTLNAGGVAFPVPSAAYSAVIAADQAEADGWPDLRCCVDVVLAWRSCDEEERLVARGMYPDLDRVAAHGAASVESARPLLGESSAAEDGLSKRLWRERVISGSVPSAAVRAILGRFAPARRFAWLSAGSLPQRYPNSSGVERGVDR